MDKEYVIPPSASLPFTRCDPPLSKPPLMMCSQLLWQHESSSQQSCVLLQSMEGRLDLGNLNAANPAGICPYHLLRNIEPYRKCTDAPLQIRTAVQRMWKPILGESDDYVANPKVSWSWLCHPCLICRQ